MPAKFVCLPNFIRVWLMLVLLPLGCDSDDELVKDNQVVDGAPVLISTIPISGGVLPSYGTLFMNFSKSPGIVTVNGTLAVVNGKRAFWNAGGLTSNQTVVLLITWAGNGGGTAAITLTIL